MAKTQSQRVSGAAAIAVLFHRYSTWLAAIHTVPLLVCVLPRLSYCIALVSSFRGQTHLLTHEHPFIHSNLCSFSLSLSQVEVISKSQAMLGPTAKLQTLGRTIVGPSQGVLAAAPPQSPLREPSGLLVADRDRPLELQEVLSEEESPMETRPRGKLPTRLDSVSRGRGAAAARSRCGPWPSRAPRLTQPAPRRWGR